MTCQVRLAIILFTIVNALFVMKYSIRFFPNYFIYLTFAYISCALLFICKLIPYIITKQKWNYVLLALGGGGIIFMALLQYSVDPFSIKVDRWSALHFPITYLLHGEYPYMAQTHLGGYGSPFPIWQLFHVPFFLLGNVGLSFFFCISLFLFCIFKVYGKERMIYVLSMITISPSVWYEAIVRSDLISNIFLCTTFIIYMTKNMNEEWIGKKLLFISTITALLTSTRLITIIPIAMFMLPWFIKMNWKKQAKSIIFFLTVLFVTFAPLAIWDWNNFFFFEHNPWSLQTRQGSFVDFVIYIPLFIFLSISWRENLKQYYFNVSCMLIVFILISMLHRMYFLNVWDPFYKYYDITYYNCAIPFLMLCISSNTSHIHSFNIPLRK